MIKRIYIALLLAAVMLLVGCGGDLEVNAEPYDPDADSEAGMRRTVLYFRDDDGFIVPVMKLIPWEEGIGAAAIGNLVDNTENRAAASALGLNATIPDGVDYTLRIVDGVATIDLCGMSALKDAESEQAMIVSIVNSLSEFPAIDAVTITFNGERVTKLPNGSTLSEAMTAFPLNTEDGEVSTAATGAEPMTLYFANSSGSLNVPVTRYAAGRGFAAAVEQLIKGPEDDALMNSFPEGTRLLSAELYNGIATVDLSEEFLEARYVEGMMQTAYDTLYLTACAIGETNELNVLVNGEECEFTAECSAPSYANTFQ